MRILFITADPPSPIRRRPWELIRAHRDRGHAVTLGFPVADPRAVAAEESLRSDGFPTISRPTRWGTRVQALSCAAFRREPLQFRWSWNPELLSALRHELHRAAAADDPYDVVHVEHLRGAAYGRRLSDSETVPIVWDSVDCISLLFRDTATHASSLKARLIARLEASTTARMEAHLVRAFDRVAVTSERDRSALLELPPPRGATSTSRIAVIANGVDTAHFHPAGTDRQPEANPTVLFSGKMSYHANETAAIDLVTKIMPLVWRRHPEVRVMIVGAEPGRGVRELATAGPSTDHAGPVGVTGRVDDLVPYLQDATVAVAPMSYAVGIQNKVLEAMACGTPVVVTTAAADGLSAVPDRDLLVGRSPADCADAIVRLIDDANLARRIGGAGRAYVRNQHRWPRVASAFEALYREAISHDSVDPRRTTP